jgi:hypothetical protein
LPLCKYVQVCALAAAGALAFACGDHPTSPRPTPEPTPTPTPTATPTPTPTPPPFSPRTLVGAGDIADCTSDNGRQGQHSEDTARLLDSLQFDALFTAGDNAYPNGSTANFNDCYHPRWGRHKSRTKPSPGNHEYESDRHDGAAYYAYFGAAAGPPGAGYYSYDLGAWHILSLNSNVPAGPGSGQWVWLREDLQQNQSKCQLAYWHHPRFSSGQNRGFPEIDLMRDIWDVLYQYNVDVVINGHDHSYEVFGEQNVLGGREPGRGIREFVVGTGGAPSYPFFGVKPNSEMQITGRYGVIRLTLNADSYQWSFLEAPNGNTLHAGGPAACH